MNSSAGSKVDSALRKLERLQKWLEERAKRTCRDCGGQNEHDHCDNIPTIDDFKQMADLLK